MSEPRPQSRLMVLMFTDIVGSVDLKQRLGDSVVAKLIRRHDQLFRQTVGAFSYAEILKDLGDGFLARFSSASDSVHAALHFQNTMHNEAWDGQRLAVRIGLHLGEVSELDVEAATGKAKLSGLAVDIAARVMGLALPGQILMTRAAFDNARQYVREHQSAEGDMPASTRKWMAHGRYLFKGAEEALEVFEVGEVGIAPLRVPPDSEKARRAVAADQEETLGWRPAVGLEIPDRKNWMLERKLGEGGFGEVWLGEHTKSKTKRVFKFCFDAERLRSFKRELMLFRLLRDTLGDRNDIAKLHEVQIDQAPFYLESEFTEDGSLVEWAEREGGIGKVPLATRLDLVARTAIAVSAAHSVGVLHKDIKPSNILIYRGNDGVPAPRLTDFGIGELTDPSVLTKRNFMMTGMSDSLITGNESSRTGTRIYAPPEVLVGKPFTIQGDVFALGVLLYQMVVGDLERPMAQGWEREVPDPLLRQDIARCVEGHENERLSSAKELAERLQSLPARRRARRRRQIARASVFASIILAGLLSLSAVWTVRERGLRLEKQEEAKKARAISDFMVNMLTSVDPRENPLEGRNVKVVDKLDQAVKQLDNGELTEEPEIEAAVRAAIGNAYRAGGQFTDAEAQLHKALDTRRSLNESSADLAQTLEDYGAIKWNHNELDAAENLFKESLEMRQKLFGEQSLEAASSENYLAATYDKQEGRHQDAEGLYRKSLATREKLANGPKRIDLIARSLNNLGTCLRYQAKMLAEQGQTNVALKRFDEAEKHIQEATSMMEEKYGHFYVDVGNGLNNIGLCRLGKKDYAGAEQAFSESLAIKRKVLGDSHISLAVTLEGLAVVYRALNRLTDAETNNRQALEIRRKVLPEGHSDISKSLDLLASILSAQGKHVDAEPLLREALANRTKALPAGHWEIADNSSRLGACLREQGKQGDAEPLLVSGYEGLKKSRGESDARTRDAADRLITLYQSTGRDDQAQALRTAMNNSAAANPNPGP